MRLFACLSPSRARLAPPGWRPREMAAHGAGPRSHEKRRRPLKDNFLVILVLGMGSVIFSSPVRAHHGFAAYDMEKRVTLKGTIADWIWSNPHCLVELDATDNNGQVVRWVLETENPSSMIRSGWNKDSLKTGDQVTVTVVPTKDGRPVGRIAQVVLPNGQKLRGRGIPADPKAPDEPAKP